MGKLVHVLSGRSDSLIRASIGAFVAGVLVTGLAGCALDNRTLLETEREAGGSAGSGTGPGGSAGTAGNGADGTGGSNPLPEAPCVYTGQPPPPGCETLVENPGFHATVDRWEAPVEIEQQVAFRWDISDASNNRGSGSMAVNNSLGGPTDGAASMGARQCIEAASKATYFVAADVLLPGAAEQEWWEGGLEDARAGLSVFFYIEPNCEGPSRMSLETDFVSAPDAWTTVRGMQTAPEGTKSMAVRLVVRKPFRQTSLFALFDNVLVRER